MSLLIMNKICIFGEQYFYYVSIIRLYIILLLCHYIQTQKYMTLKLKVVLLLEFWELHLYLVSTVWFFRFDSLLGANLLASFLHDGFVGWTTLSEWDSIYLFAMLFNVMLFN